MSSTPLRPRVLTAALAVGLAVSLPVPALAAEATTIEPYEARIDLTLPTVGDASFSDDYHHPRGGGRVHRATDLTVPKHTPAHAAVDGTVCHITGIDAPMPSWGYSLSICDDRGRRFNYVHLNNDRPGTDDGAGGPEHAYAPGVRRGATVARGQLVGWIGDSGNAEETVSHLHFEIDDPSITDPYGSQRRNPFRSLRAAVLRGDVPDGAAEAPDEPDPQRGPTEPTDEPTGPTARVAGPDRVATAIALSRTAFDRARDVVLAPSTSASQAIVAGPLAAALGGPVLTTHPDALDARVVTELGRLDARRVVTVGLPPRIAGSLADAGVEVERLGGVDVFATAAAVAERYWQVAGDDAARTAIVSLGTHPDPSRAWPDSLMASYYGAATGQPVLLVTPDGVPEATAGTLGGIREVTVIGGTAAVSRGTADRIRATGASLTRLYGVTRYSTALAVSEALVRRGVVSPDRTWAATGRNWPDAATSGPVVARHGDLLVLVDGAGEGGDAETRDYIGRRADAVERVVGIGGVAAVAEPALGALARWVR